MEVTETEARQCGQVPGEICWPGFGLAGQKWFTCLVTAKGLRNVLHRWHLTFRDVDVGRKVAIIIPIKNSFTQQ